MEQKKDKPWKIMWWEAHQYKLGTSDECLHKLDYDKNTCYDPITHETHPCVEELCPLHETHLKYYTEDGRKRRI